MIIFPRIARPRLRISKQRTGFLLILLLFCLVPSPAEGFHPVSHVDAWVRISDRLEVKMIVFLDDIVRFQNPAVNAAGRISRAELIAALERHADTIRRQIRIFDAAGRQLQGELLALPPWDHPSADVDSKAEANLRLSYQFQFPLVEPDRTIAFTFLPSLSHPQLISPPELRLHAAHNALGQRIDAVIPDGRPHTIRFRAAGQGSKEGVSTLSQPLVSLPEGDPNSASSTWTLSRRTLVHEFVAPLARMGMTSETTGFALPYPAELPTQTPAVPLVTEAESESLRASIADWFRSNLLLYGPNHRRIAADAKVEVRFLAADSAEPIAGSAQATKGEPLNPLTALVGVRCRFPGIFSIRDLSVGWRGSPGTFDVVSMACVTPFASESVPLSLSSDEPERLTQLEFPVSAEPRFEGTVSVSSGALPWTQQIIFPTRRGLVISAATAAAALVLMIRYGVRRRLSLFCCLLLFGLAVLIPLFDRQVTFEPDSLAAKQIVDQLLLRAYSATLISDADESIDQMTRVLEPELAETLFVSIEQSFPEQDQLPPAVQLRGVELLECQCTEVSPEQGTFLVDCRWRVRGDVFHWGHVHSRSLLLQGQLLIRAGQSATAAESWRLEELNLDSLTPEDTGVKVAGLQSFLVALDY